MIRKLGISTSILILLITFIGCSYPQNESPKRNEFIYNYIDTDLASEEKQVLEIAKKAAIEKFGQSGYEEDMPYSATKIFGASYPDGIYWKVVGTLYCDGKIANGNCVGGTIEVEISDRTLDVRDIYHGQ